MFSNMLSVCPSVRTLSVDTDISVLSGEIFLWNLAHMCTILVGFLAEMVFKVIGQRAKSCASVNAIYRPNGGGIHFDGLASRLITLVSCLNV